MSAAPLWTKEMRALWKSYGISGLVVDIEEYESLGMPFLRFIIYRDNFEQFPPFQKMSIESCIQDFFLKLRSRKVPIYLEVRASVPASARAAYGRATFSAPD